jgi:Mg/Co/Ni transporter MgtE
LLGVVHFQRMLRYPPHERLGSLIDEGTEPVHVATSAAEVSRILASYNLVSVPVVDDAGRLVGGVTIDDVLDHILPDDWRSHDNDANTPKRRKTRTRSKAPAGKAPTVKAPLKPAAPKKRKE